MLARCETCACITRATRLRLLDVVFPLLFSQIVVSASESLSVTQSLSLSTAVRTVYHDCDRRYDCARGDYAPLMKGIIYHDCQLRYDCYRDEYAPVVTHTTPTPRNGTTRTTLLAILRVRIPLSLEAFTIDERLRFREAVARVFRVPLFLVYIRDVAEGEADGGRRLLAQYVHITCIIGQYSLTACAPVPCEAVLMQHKAEHFIEFPGATFIELPVCKLCEAEDQFVFASAGTLDDPFSCRRECSAGFFQFRGLDTASCERHSQPMCASGQFLRQGTSSSDASCVNCSTCEGARFVSECSTQTDTVCEACADAGPRQHWIGEACSPACDTGFVWDTRTRECAFCARSLCEPGTQTPVVQDNCSHCVVCPPHPPNAHWSAQDDRFDCMWLCDEKFELSALGCVAHQSAVDTLVLLQPVCDPGHVSVNFVCVPCFEAAAMGHVRLQDLPLPAELDIRWEWFYGCQWRCLHAAGYWELRADSGMYWECASTKQHNIMLRGIDMSWAAGTQSNTTPSTGLRREAAAENSTLLRTVLVLIAVPVIVLVCTVLASLAVLCRGTAPLSEESQPLLYV
jgi:hypothetical protein